MGGCREHDTSSAQQHIIATEKKNEERRQRTSPISTRERPGRLALFNGRPYPSHVGSPHPFTSAAVSGTGEGKQEKAGKEENEVTRSQVKANPLFTRGKGWGMKCCRANAAERKGEPLKRRLLQQTMPTQFYLRVNVRRICRACFGAADSIGPLSSFPFSALLLLPNSIGTKKKGKEKKEKRAGTD